MALLSSPAVTATTVTLLIMSLFFDLSYGRYGIVGGLKDVKNVKTNKEIQELGRFSVQEHNRIRRKSLISDGGAQLVFLEVVKAETQVVKGVNYYLEVKATRNGILNTFHSVVWVQPFADSKPQLLKFAPYSN